MHRSIDMYDGSVDVIYEEADPGTIAVFYKTAGVLCQFIPTRPPPSHTTAAGLRNIPLQ